MNTNGGKGYFYSMGARDRHYGKYNAGMYKRDWPAWACMAYANGYQDNAAWRE